MTHPLIECIDLTHSYQRGSEPLMVLDHLNLTIAEQAFVALMGPSGSGKSTLLNLIAGLETPTGGQVIVDQLVISELSEASLAGWRAVNIGFVFQFYNLIPVLSALDNVALPLLLTDHNKKQRKEAALTALELVGLSDRAQHKPNELSGGQQQRVAIARAIVANPKLLVCDEPTGDLDRRSADEILSLLTMLNEDFGKTIVMVTHDPHAAASAQSVWHMNKGVLTRSIEGELA